MKKKIILCIIILVLSLIIIALVTKRELIKKDERENQLIAIDYTENQDNEDKSVEEQEKITQITEAQGLKADENIYDIYKEYDGREVIVIKASVKFKVALAGIIKQGKPEYVQINDLLNKAPKHTGIWVAEKSRNQFLEILNKIAKAKYKFNEEGFLLQTRSIALNKYDENINNMLSDGRLHIFDVNSVTYSVDEVTGEIQEYPFEEMDPYSEYEYFSSEDKEMFIISENSYGKINQEETLKNIFK